MSRRYEMVCQLRVSIDCTFLTHHSRNPHVTAVIGSGSRRRTIHLLGGFFVRVVKDTADFWALCWVCGGCVIDTLRRLLGITNQRIIVELTTD